MPEQKSQQRRNAAIIIAFFAALLIAAVVFGVFQVVNSPGRSNSVSVRVPLIRTPLVSASDGQEYNVQTQFHVQMDRDAQRSVNTQLLETALSEIMTGMDYDSLAGPNGVDYINSRATEQLNERLSVHTETRVVVTGLATDDRVKLEEPVNQELDNMFKGLFQNIN